MIERLQREANCEQAEQMAREKTPATQIVRAILDDMQREAGRSAKPDSSSPVAGDQVQIPVPALPREYDYVGGLHFVCGWVRTMAEGVRGGRFHSMEHVAKNLDALLAEVETVIKGGAS